MTEYEDPSQYMPTELEKKLLMSLVFTSTLEEHEKEETMREINECTDYRKFQLIEFQLEDQQQSIHQIPNPNQKDITRHLRKVQ